MGTQGGEKEGGLRGVPENALSEQLKRKQRKAIEGRGGRK